jgi:hypothetical protein
VLKPSLYATSLRTRSLRPVRVPSDQNTRWRLPVHILLIRDKNSLSLHICLVDHYIFPESGGRLPQCRTRATVTLNLHLDKVFYYLLPHRFNSKPSVTLIGLPTLTQEDQSQVIAYSLETLISWKSKKQYVVSRSSGEAEYRSMTFTCSELTWLRYLLQDLCISHPQAAQVYCDNQATLSHSCKPSFSRTHKTY